MDRHGSLCLSSEAEAVGLLRLRLAWAIDSELQDNLGCSVRCCLNQKEKRY